MSDWKPWALAALVIVCLSGLVYAGKDVSTIVQLVLSAGAAGGAGAAGYSRGLFTPVPEQKS